MDKRTPLREALAAVKPGARVALGGMTLYRRPVAAALALAAAAVRDLEIVTFTGGIETDLLIGAGCVRTLRSCYTGLEIVGLAPHFSRTAREGTIRVVEETEYTLSHAVQAGAMRMPFLPLRGTLMETDIYGCRPDLKPFPCPITGQTLLAVPALHVDVAIIHAAAADCSGNCNLAGQLALDPYLPMIADATIVTAERIVETGELTGMLGGVQIPGIFVTHVAPVPSGARPTSCFPDYGLDLAAVVDYAEAAADAGAWAKWLDAAILAVPAA
jgi:glutaconate CoA-transferase, subunit A